MVDVMEMILQLHVAGKNSITLHILYTNLY